MSYRLSGCPQAAISLAPDLNAFQHNTQVQGKYNAASANFFSLSITLFKSLLTGHSAPIWRWQIHPQRSNLQQTAICRRAVSTVARDLDP
jgi:hypothetical protein